MTNGLIGIVIATTLLLQVDHTDKRCVVTKVLKEGVYSNCDGWEPPKGEKMVMPVAVSKRLKVGDTFYFVWKETRWVAEIKPTIAVTIDANQPAIIMSRVDAQAKFKQLCADGSDDRTLRALADALNPIPNWPQMVMNGDASVCQRNPKPLVPVPVGTSWP